MHGTITDQLKVIIAEISGIDCGDIELSDRLRDNLRLDSVSIVQLQVELEDAFGVRFDPIQMDMAEIFQTVQSLGAFLEVHTATDNE